MNAIATAELPSDPVLLLRRHDDRTRRRDDLIDSRSMVGLVRFLMNRPTCDQIAEHIVLALLSSSGARAAVISQFGSDGSLHLVGSFGIPAEQLARYRVSSMWDRSPLADAVRSGQPVIIGDPAELAARYPWAVDDEMAPETVAVWPLALPQERVGALLLHLGSDLDTDSLRIDVSGLVAMLALYLGLIASPAEPVREPARPLVTLVSGGAPAATPAVPERLSDRQLEILQFIARGMTNPQISHRIGFSESTVRQESMAIYRFLGVGGRRDAVKVAQSRGLLTQA